MSNFLPPDHILAFRAVMAEGSLSAAARALGMAQPTLRRHVEALETNLKTRLFTRASNGLTPTPLAEILRPIADAMAAEAEAFRRAASSGAHDRAGTVRVTTSRVLACHVMPLALRSLGETAPDIRIELTASDTPENLLHRAADIAVRLAEPTQGALVARRLARIPFGFHAAPGLFRDVMPSDIATLPFISDDRDRAIEPALAELGLPQPGNVVLRCDDALTQISAISAGLGLGVCQCAIAARLGLERHLPHLETSLPCYLVIHEDLAQITRIRTVFDHLATHLPALLAPPPEQAPTGG